MPADAAKGLQFREPPIFERGAPGRTGASLAELDVPPVDPAEALGKLVRSVPAGLPEVSEPEAFRHFVRLSQWNFSIDTQFYPLGSCTMKYNPKVNEWAARLDGFANLHPWTPEHLAQGALDLMVRLSDLLAEIVGMDGVSLQPAAGAQGELTGLMMIRAYHQSRGRSPKKIFIPDSAHGTNPASCALNGFEAVPFHAGGAGVVEPETLARALEAAGDDVAGMMMTNPNTLGLFESAMPRLTELVHCQLDRLARSLQNMWRVAPCSLSAELREHGGVVGGRCISPRLWVRGDAGDLVRLGVHGLQPGQQGVADQDVVDQLPLAFEDAGVAPFGRGFVGLDSTVVPSPRSGWLNPPVPHWDPGGPYNSCVVAACSVSFRSPSTTSRLSCP